MKRSMRRTMAITLSLASAVGILFSTPSRAEDSARDRADLEAAAGRAIFQNVLLADPTAFSRRASPRSEFARLANPTAGDSSRDRSDFDAAAGRIVFGNEAASEAVAPSSPSRGRAVGGRRPVRVILASPYGR